MRGYGLRDVPLGLATEGRSHRSAQGAPLMWFIQWVPGQHCDAHGAEMQKLGLPPTPQGGAL